MNTNRLIAEIEKEIKRLKHLESHLENKLELSVNGRLEVKQKTYGFQYYVDKKYISKANNFLPQQLAQRDYMRKLLPKVRERIKKQTELLRLLENGGPDLDEVYRELTPGRKVLVDPMITLKEDFIESWKNEDYRHWEIKDGDVKGDYRTALNERVRSKAEALIADRLTYYGVPYHYEYPLELIQNGKKVIIRPDFITLNERTLKIFVLEHLGLMDDPLYFRRAMEKVGLYEENGYLLGVNLLLTHETKEEPLNMTVLDRYIEEYLL